MYITKNGTSRIKTAKGATLTTPDAISTLKEKEDRAVEKQKAIDE